MVMGLKGPHRYIAVLWHNLGDATIVQGTIVQGELLSNDTVFQGDPCPMGLLSKEAFTGEMLLIVKSLFKLIFFIWYWKKIHEQSSIGQTYALDKSHLGLTSACTVSTWTKLCMDNFHLGQSSLGYLLLHPNLAYLCYYEVIDISRSLDM